MSEPAALMNLLRSLLWHPGTGVLIGLLLVAAWTDWRSLRIPNWLTVSGMVWGLAFNVLDARSPGAGLLLSVGGLATGLALLMPGYLLRVMGAGDVKLMAMVGAFLGPLSTLKATLIVFIVGGLMALAWSAWKRALPLLAQNTRLLATSMVLPGVRLWRPSPQAASVGSLPYGISISLGTITFVTLRQLVLA
jgi:prepilin peptidase CpaA